MGYCRTSILDENEIQVALVFQAAVRYVAIVSLMLIALLPLRLLADDLSSAFQSANKLYEESKFAEAAVAYEKLVQSGQTSPALYFHLVKPLFKSGQIGRAIVACRQATHFAPHDPAL